MGSSGEKGLEARAQPGSAGVHHRSTAQLAWLKIAFQMQGHILSCSVFPHARTHTNKHPCISTGPGSREGKEGLGPRRPPTERPRLYPLVPFLGSRLCLLPDMSMETHAGFPEATGLFLGSGCPFPQGHILLRHHDADRTMHGGLKGPCMGDLAKRQHRSAWGGGGASPPQGDPTGLPLSPRKSWNPGE